MIVVLIHWRIKPDDRNDTAFLRHWREENRIVNRDDLIAEFLTKSLPPEAFHRVNWSIEDSEDSSEYISYFTFGLWRSLAAFDSAVSPYYGEGRLLDFEKSPRRRAVFDPVDWRVGSFPLPEADSPQTR